MLKRFGTLGAAVWLIFLGIISIVEIILLIIAKKPAERSQDLTTLIVVVVIGLIYYSAFRLLGGWRTSTWDSPNEGRKTLLFIIGLPGLVVGAVVLIFVIWFWLSDTTSSSNYHLAKKKKPVSADQLSETEETGIAGTNSSESA